VRIEHCWEVLNAALEGKDFLVGNSVTLADVDLYVAMNFAGWVRQRVPETAGNLLAFRDRIKALVD
jgi:glutathione S-transferase